MKIELRKRSGDLVLGPGVHLVAGANEVRPEAWDAVKDLVTTKWWVEHGFVVPAEPVEEPPAPESFELAEPPEELPPSEPPREPPPPAEPVEEPKSKAKGSGKRRR